MIYFLFMTPAGWCALVMIAILAGIVVLPLHTVLYIAGGVLLFASVILLILAPPWAALSVPLGVLLIIVARRIQRRQDDHEAESIRDDLSRYSGANDIYIGRE